MLRPQIKARMTSVKNTFYVTSDGVMRYFQDRLKHLEQISIYIWMFWDVYFCITSTHVVRK